MELQRIQNKIYELRGLRVMFDFDLEWQEVVANCDKLPEKKQEPSVKNQDTKTKNKVIYA